MVDVAGRRVRDRDGAWYAVNPLVVAESGLYYERPIVSDDPIENAKRLFEHQQRWILPGPGWVLNRFRFLPQVARPIDWYIEPEIVSVSDSLWTVRDGYLDVSVSEGVRYEVDDADELGQAILAGDIPLDEAAQALDALARLLRALERLEFSGRALLREFAPGLPGPEGIDG